MAERLEVAQSHLWPGLLDAYGLARRVVPLSAEALDLVVTGYAAPGEAGLRSVETRMETLLHRAIAQGAPTRRVWITPEFVAERLGPRPEDEGGSTGGLSGSARPGWFRSPRAREVWLRCRGSACQSLGCRIGPRCGWWELRVLDLSGPEDWILVPLGIIWSSDADAQYQGGEESHHACAADPSEAGEE